jgi:hypothetical protein
LAPIVGHIGSRLIASYNVNTGAVAVDVHAGVIEGAGIGTTGGGTVTDAHDEKVGEKRSLYCSVCEGERTFVRVAWRGVEFFGYPPEQEYGWECTACGSQVRLP